MNPIDSRVLTLMWLLAVALPCTVRAATLYVNNSGSPACSDSTARAGNSISFPWCTITRATKGAAPGEASNGAEAAVADDVVMVAAGTYSVAGTGRHQIPAYNPINSGSSGHVVTFRCHPSESQVEGPSGSSCILQLSSSRGPVIGAFSVDFISWDGFYVDEANAAPAQDTGPVVFINTTGSTIQNSEIKGRFVDFNPAGTNHNGVRVQSARRCRIYNNRIYNFGHMRGGPAWGENDTAVTFYDSADNVVEHNEIYGSGGGIFIKGQLHSEPTNLRNIIRYNYIHDQEYGEGIKIGGSKNAQVYQNLILAPTRTARNGIGIAFKSFGPNEKDGPSGDTVQNNTVVGQSGAVNGAPSACLWANNASIRGITIWNNICASGHYGVHVGQAPGADFSFEHNIYYSNDNVANMPGTSSVTLGTWQRRLAKDTVAPAARGNNPLFAGGGDYRLRAGSYALKQGRDTSANISGRGAGATIPAGAYITGTETIGIERQTAHEANR